MADEREHERQRHTFRRFSDAEAVPLGSPIYERLCEVVQADDALLDVAAEARPGQPIPNLFFGAVHALIEEHPGHPLAEYYPDLGGRRPLDDGIAAAFRAFVLEQREAVTELLRTRLVQTNEVRRSAVLFPVCVTVAAEAGGAPLALIEIGASAGLNLIFDRYGYRYSGAAAGNPDSPLVLETTVRDGAPPLGPLPRVVSRLGLEVNALDVHSESDMRWLRALVWPEHDERRRVLRQAIAIARAETPEVRTADVLGELAPAILAAPAGAAVVVIATFVLNQFSAEMLDRLKSLLLESSRQREVFVVVVGFSEWFGGAPRDFGEAPAVLARLRGGRGSWQQLARSDPHAWWLEWTPGEAGEW